MSAIVADASVIVEYLLGSSRGSGLERALRGREHLHIPALCDVEVTSALRRAVLRDLLEIDRALDALEDYLELPFDRHGHTYLLGRVMSLRRNFSAAGGIYLALAERLDASFLTADERLTRAVRKHLDVRTL